uniref:Multiple inositol polyphosphate phosphatase 1 n=1 Tax=Ciona savignyi TaxID=51511 RepID=H2ZCE5_CIOSA
MVALYQLCAFDKALHDRNQLCSGFSRFFFEVLEYVSDLKHFYKTGYGFRINYLLACPLLEDIVRRLDASVEPNSKNGSVVLRFGHAETLIPLLCLLGLYQDDVRLTAHNFPRHRHSRKFRTGTFSPFAGNVAIVLYKFGTNFKIAVVVNERVVKLPFAQCHYCDYSTFKHLLSKRLEGIKCNTVCDLNRHTEL